LQGFLAKMEGSCDHHSRPQGCKSGWSCKGLMMNKAKGPVWHKNQKDKGIVLKKASCTWQRSHLG